MVQNIIQLPLSATGIDIGVAIADIGYSVSSTYVTGTSSGGGNTGTPGTPGSK
jgi:hypothetical protein